MLIKWNDKYNVGNPIIDEQHQKLIQIAQKANGILHQQTFDKYEEVRAVLDELKDYTRFHFETEEQIMLQGNFSNYIAHKKLHDEFLFEIEEMISKVYDDLTDNTIRAILNFLVEWLIGHIYGNDKNMVLEITK
ncbi:MAG: hypothetical protein ATN36_01695 [Epulopiscium sp. Nele67-Bin005]|nr:MAG: hypothetical protein ATN36_01695 [Epulopiscium sp. Nele67-Bin005]